MPLLRFNHFIYCAASLIVFTLYDNSSQIFVKRGEMGLRGLSSSPKRKMMINSPSSFSSSGAQCNTELAHINHCAAADVNEEDCWVGMAFAKQEMKYVVMRFP